MTDAADSGADAAAAAAAVNVAWWLLCCPNMTTKGATLSALGPARSMLTDRLNCSISLMTSASMQMSSSSA